MLITSKNQLRYTITDSIIKYEDCIINIKYSMNKEHKPIYVISNRLDKNLLSISTVVEYNTIGKIINKNKSDINNILDKYLLDYISDDIRMEISVINKNNNFISFKKNKKEYLNRYNNLLKYQKPMEVKPSIDIINLFLQYLYNDNGDKFIISFSSFITDLKYNFILNLYCDKFYSYHDSLLSIGLIRYDENYNKIPLDYDCGSIIEFSENKDNKDYNKEALEEFIRIFTIAYNRCLNVSNFENKIKLNVYSNVKLKY